MKAILTAEDRAEEPRGNTGLLETILMTTHGRLKFRRHRRVKFGHHVRG